MKSFNYRISDLNLQKDSDDPCPIRTFHMICNDESLETSALNKSYKMYILQDHLFQLQDSYPMVWLVEHQQAGMPKSNT